MANNYTAKAQALRDEFLGDIRQTLPALARATSFGSAGECDALIGAGTAGSDSAFVRVRPVPTIAVDVLGLAQQSFTPHVAQVVFEANPTAGAGADVGTWATRMTVLGALIERGIRVELYLSANTAAVSAAGITGAPTATFNSHSQYGQMASV